MISRATIAAAPNAQGLTDLQIIPTGNSRGRIALDMTLASPLLVALSTDRRAEPEDITPAQLNGVTPGVFDRRGYVGDVLLPDDQRLGSRLWLFARAKRTEETRQAVNAAVLDAVNDIADYHGVTIDAATAWGAQGQLTTQISVDGTTVLTYEASR